MFVNCINIVLFMQAEGKPVPGMKSGEKERNMDDIEHSLIKGEPRTQCGIDDFERVFENKRAIGEAVAEYRHKNQASKNNIALAQQRLVQIELLAGRAEKQSVLLRNQIQKVNEAHTMTKILTIEKMIKARTDHEDMQRKKQTIFRIREDKNRAALRNQSRGHYRTEKLRQFSLLESRQLKEAYYQEKSQTIEAKRSRAEQVRDDKQRLKDRLQRYEKFKLEQSKRNYLGKMEQLKETLDEREKKLDLLYREELKQERNFQTTEKVTKEYMGSLFPTETI